MPVFFFGGGRGAQTGDKKKGLGQSVEPVPLLDAVRAFVVSPRWAAFKDK